MGITHPSVKGQENVVRKAYERAKLNPNLTAYAELHGTGTPVGDPIEARAISRALNDTRSAEKPLLMGAVCFFSQYPQAQISQAHVARRSNQTLDIARQPAASSL